MPKRTPSSKRWLAEHAADHYVHEARRLGYRSRSTFKLKEMDERDHLLRPGIVVVDLGAAPGGWCQYVRGRLGAHVRLFAIDALPMEPLQGVSFLQGDFREAEVLQQLEAALAGAKVDLVLSDLAPNITGIDAADQAGSVALAELALEFARGHLAPAGSLVMKVFQGEGFDPLLKEVRRHFGKVSIRKPKASRPRSREVYLVAQRYRVV